MYIEDKNKESSTAEFLIKNKLIKIMLIDESESNRRLALHGLSEAQIIKHITLFGNFEDAITHLQGLAISDKPHLPGLILVGSRVFLSGATKYLDDLRSHFDSTNIPIGVLVISEDEELFLKQKNLPADCFLIKPEELASASNLVKCFTGFRIAIIKNQGET